MTVDFQSTGVNPSPYRRGLFSSHKVYYVKSYLMLDWNLNRWVSRLSYPVGAPLLPPTP